LIPKRFNRWTSYLLAEGLGPFLIRSLAGSGVVQICGMFVTFLVGVQLARGLGVAGFGYYGIAMAAISVASIPGQFGLPKLVMREVAGAIPRDDLPVLFGVIRWADRTSYAISTVVLVALFAGTFLFLHGPVSPLGAALLLGSPLVPLVALLRIRGAALQGLHFVVRGRIPDTLLRPALFSILLFALFHFAPAGTVAEAMALSSIAAAVAFIVAGMWLRPRLPPRPLQVTETPRQWLSSSIPIGISDGLRVLQPQLAILLLGAATNPTEVSLFRIAVSTATTLGAPTVLVNGVIFPVLARLHAQKDHARLQTLVTRSARAQFAGTLLLSAPLLLAGKPLLTLVFGAQYAPATLPMGILLLGLIVNTAFGPNAPLLNMTGLERRVTRALIVAMVMTTISVAVLGRIYGALGTAIAILISQLTWNLLVSSDAKRLLGINTTVVPGR
jgi:O-antigen/teichoic acid export membrane protein